MSSGARSRRRWLAPVAGGLILLLAGCAKNAPQDSLEPVGKEAQKIDNLVMPVFIVAGIVFVLVLAGAVFVGWKFRSRDDDDYNEFPEQVHGNFKMEIGWTIAPALLLGVIGIFSVVTIFDLAKEPKDDALHVEVIGQQWWWEYRYDLNGDGEYDEIITANDLVIPTGRQVALRITSRDVIHSFWAPRLNGKKDAVPGRVHPLTIETDKTGEYLGQCAEFCGLSHAEMRIKVVALSPDKFDEWTKNQRKKFENPTAEDAKGGWSAFAGQCTTCHVIRDMPDPSSTPDPADATKMFQYPEVKNQVSGEAPDLTHFASRTTFAGAKFDLRRDTPACRKLGENWARTEDGVKRCLNRPALEAWLRNPPAEKAMAAGDTPTPHSRGMPNFNLTEDQINQLVAFLMTLK